MKTYAAIGHWKESKETTCIALKVNSIADFRSDLRANEFVPYTIISEKRLAEIKEVFSTVYCDGLLELIGRMTPHYRKSTEIIDYLEQCLDILEDRMAKAE